jgi:hypothetical protein
MGQSVMVRVYNSRYQGGRERRITSSTGIVSETLFRSIMQKQNKTKNVGRGDGNFAQEVECLLRICKVLGSTPNITQKKS